eukprot:gene4438-20677_t
MPVNLVGAADCCHCSDPPFARRWSTAVDNEYMLIRLCTYNGLAADRGIPNETSVELLLLAVRKKYRKCGIGHWLLETLKDPGTSGPYDAICTYADPQAATFFATNGFTDDVILNSKFRKVGDNWLNSTPMCFIPRFTLCSSQKKAATCTESVTSLDIEELERNIRAWKMEQTIAYQKQMTCILAATQQLKRLKKTKYYAAGKDTILLRQVESQQKAIARLKEENSKLHTKMDVSDNRKFWRAIKPVFAEKIQATPSITLEENGELISDDRKIAELLNNYFLNITQDLGIPKIKLTYHLQMV